MPNAGAACLSFYHAGNCCGAVAPIFLRCCVSRCLALTMRQAASVKVTNPFSPSVALIIVPQRDRRRGLGKTFLIVLAVQALVISALLLHAASNYPESAANLNSVNPEKAGRPILIVRARESMPASSPPVANKPAVKPTELCPAPIPCAVEAATPMIAEKEKPAPKSALHVVKPGDTLYNLARSYRTSISSIRQANGLMNDKLTVGARLKIVKDA